MQRCIHPQGHEIRLNQCAKTIWKFFFLSFPVSFFDATTDSLFMKNFCFYIEQYGTAERETGNVTHSDIHFFNESWTMCSFDCELNTFGPKNLLWKLENHPWYSQKLWNKWMQWKSGWWVKILGILWEYLVYQFIHSLIHWILNAFLD